MLSTVISKKRGRDDISTDSFDVYVPQKRNRYGDELALRLSGLSLNKSFESNQEQYKVYHYKLIDTKQMIENSETTTRIGSVVTISKQDYTFNTLSQIEQQMIEQIQYMITTNYELYHSTIYNHMIQLVTMGNVSIDYPFLFNQKSVTVLYLAIYYCHWDHVAGYLDRHADSTFSLHHETETPAVLFMERLRTQSMLDPILDNLLSTIRKQVDECIRHKENHPEDDRVLVKPLNQASETYDVYMATTENMVYSKPDNGLLSDDLLKNADYEMDDTAHQFYMFDEYEGSEEEDDDEDSQNRSETWEYGSDVEDEVEYGYQSEEEDYIPHYEEEYNPYYDEGGSDSDYYDNYYYD